MNAYRTDTLFEPVEDFKFVVREFTSADGGETWYYTGHGRFCRSQEEADAWILLQKMDTLNLK